MITRGLVASSLVQTGRAMTLFGLLVGVAFYLAMRYGRPSRGAVGEGQDEVMRMAAKPLIALGLVGAVLWIVGTLR
jgi:hypothetical protein